MKKTRFFTAIIAAAMLTAALTACGGEQPEAPVTPDEPETVTESGEQGEQPEETDVSENNAAEEPGGEFVVEIEGIKFDLAAASSLRNQEQEEITAEEAYALHQAGENYGASWEGMALVKQSSGESLNSIDNPDAFVEGHPSNPLMTVNEEIPLNTNEVKTVYDGDVIDGLTVKNASYGYLIARGADTEIITFSNFGCGYELDGELTLTGYIIVAAELEPPAEIGDILFFPDAESAAGVSFLSIVPGDSSPSHYAMSVGDFHVYNEDLTIMLGTIFDEEYADVDLSTIPEDGTAKQVEVTFSGIEVRQNDQVGAGIFARIVEIN